MQVATLATRRRKTPTSPPRACATSGGRRPRRSASTASGPRVWELEQKALGSAEAMAAQRDRAVANELIVGRVLAPRPSMKLDREEMVRRLWTGGEGLVVVVGEAGTGKTYALAAAARGWSAQTTCPELRVAAPTWRAANVLRSEGLAATSVAKLLAELDGGAQGAQQGLSRARSGWSLPSLGNCQPLDICISASRGRRSSGAMRGTCGLGPT
jgi:hypothetical protein